MPSIKSRQNTGLHIPDPICRPGDEPDFSGLIIPEAGSVPRPNFDAEEQTLRSLPYGLIRTLDDKG